MMQATSLYVRRREGERPGSLLAAIAAALLALALVVTPASAGGGISLWPSEDPTAERFNFSIGLQGCEEPDYIVSQNGSPVDVDLDVQAEAEQSGADWNINGSFSVAELEPGQYDFLPACPESEGLPSSFTVNRLTVEKQVEGDVPEDAEFVIAVECTVEANGSPEANFALDLTYPAPGGTDSLLTPVGSACNVEETDDGGAESVTISNGEDLFFGAGDGESTTVTNTFPEAEEEEEEPEDEEEEPEAEPAEPVEDEPDYTG